MFENLAHSINTVYVYKSISQSVFNLYYLFKTFVYTNFNLNQYCTPNPKF